jgi:hypothetical protein
MLGYAMGELVEALHYKLEGCGFDSHWCHWNFLLAFFFWPHYGVGLTQPLIEMSTRNISLEGGGGGGCKGSRLLGLTTLPTSFASCLEIWEPQPYGSLWACPGLY